MSKSMQHWNGDQLIAIDIETTGTDHTYHEIIQLAMIPLDSKIKPRHDVPPLNLYIAPEHPERVDPEAEKVTGVNIRESMRRGMDKEKAKDILEDWVDTLSIPLNKYGSYRKKMIPLGHNVAKFDLQFIKYWLGDDRYDPLFDCRPRDTMIIAAYLNDKAAMQSEPVPFSKINLTWLSKKLDVEWVSKKHSAIEDARVTAEVYRKLITRSFFV